MNFVLPEGVIRPPINLIQRAQLFSYHAHLWQVRKNATEDPYNTHTIEVATLVAMSGGSEVEIAAGHLHDTVEDTDTTIELIAQLFGADVARIVRGLTDPPEFKGLPTLVRKGEQAKRLRSKNKSVKRVKLADVVSNTRSLVSDPPVNWDFQKCSDSLAGAFIVAQVCSDVSSFLEHEFQACYQAAQKIYTLH